MTNPATRCFVIMPFGEKTDVDGRRIDFDRLYDELIKGAVTGATMREAGGPAIDCVRCDEIEQSGWVHRQMITHILDSEVVVVDLSTLNPNVFYELGVRHALRSSVTVLVCRAGTRTPFNLQGFKAIRYDPDDTASMQRARGEIARYVAQGLKTTQTDSLVHEVLKERRPQGVAAKPLAASRPVVYRLRDLPNKRIGLLTGDLRDVNEPIDVWVNSENTNMQMARFFDRSGSAVIRYFGARRDIAGQVVEDTIADELARALGGHPWVPPGTVIATSAGELAASHGVQRILHVAAVQGELGRGYGPVAHVDRCVTNVLNKAGSAELGVDARSILLPLMGTGTGGAELGETIGQLFDAALNYFERQPAGRLSTVWFQAYTDQQLETCLRVLAQRAVERLSDDGTVAPAGSPP